MSNISYIKLHHLGFLKMLGYFDNQAAPLITKTLIYEPFDEVISYLSMYLEILHLLLITALIGIGNKEETLV